MRMAKMEQLPGLQKLSVQGQVTYVHPNPEPLASASEPAAEEPSRPAVPPPGYAVEFGTGRFVPMYVQGSMPVQVRRFRGRA